MEYYAPAQGGPSSYAGLEGSIGDPGAGSSLVHEVWPLEHVAPSPAGPNADAGLDDVWQMTQDGMDGSPGLYPERPGEQDCPFYMRTGLCGFGMSCRFNHPPNRKLAAAAARGKGEYPERIGQPECQYYLKTGNCKFGATCKYHHPRDKAGSTGRVQLNVLGLPLRPNEKECAYYMRTGQCKYSVTCKFHHPQPAVLSPSIYPGGPSAPPPAHYQGALPSWPGITRTPYLNPRLQSSYTSVLLPPPQTLVSVPTWSTYQGPVGPLQSPDGQHAIGTSYVYGPAPQADQIGVHGTFSPYLQGSAAMGLPALQAQPLGLQKETSFPERPGQPECQYYMKTGDCKFGITCRYHHPKDRATPSPTCTLSPMGLPLRPGAPPCTFYTKYGICKFGPTCKFDHPLGALNYSPSASSLTDVAVAPYPIGSSPTTLAPSSSSTDSRVQEVATLARSSSKEPVPEVLSSQTRESSTEAVTSSSSTQPGQAQSASASQPDTLIAS